MALNNFADVKAFLSKVMADNGEAGGLPNSPHKDFWNNLTYQQFTTGNVPGVNDPKTNQPIPILVKGSSATSTIILSLQGKGPLFDPNTGDFGQMPANGPPMFTAAQIQQLANWIDAGCPE